MGMKFSTGGGGGDFTPLPAGTYAAICTLLADLGVQEGSGMYPDPKHQMVVTFQVPSERIEEQEGYKGDSEGPMTISQRFTASMNQKANLRKFLEGWRGKKFSDAEAADFDIAKLLGVPAMLTVTEYTNANGEKRTKIASASPLMKGMEKPKPEGDLLLYTADSQKQFDSLPKWVREAIENQVGGRTVAAGAPQGDDDGDSVPF